MGNLKWSKHTQKSFLFLFNFSCLDLRLPSRDEVLVLMLGSLTSPPGPYQRLRFPDLGQMGHSWEHTRPWPAADYRLQESFRNLALIHTAK